MNTWDKDTDWAAVLEFAKREFPEGYPDSALYQPHSWDHGTHADWLEFFRLYWADESKGIYQTIRPRWLARQEYDGSDDGKCACCGGDRKSRYTCSPCCDAMCNAGVGWPVDEVEIRKRCRAFGIKTGRYKPVKITDLKPVSATVVKEPDWEAIAKFALERHPDGSPHPMSGVCDWGSARRHDGGVAAVIKTLWNETSSNNALVKQIKSEWFDRERDMKTDYVAPSPTGKLPKGDPWCCPVCLRSDRPKAKDATMCERCKPSVRLNVPKGCREAPKDWCDAVNDQLRTDNLRHEESKALAVAEIRWAMAKHRSHPMHCNRNMEWAGAWEHVKGRAVAVTMKCAECGLTDKQQLEVRG